MPLVDDDFGAIGDRPVLVLDTPEFTSVRFMAFPKGPGTSGPTSAWGSTARIAAKRLRARAVERAPRRALLPDGGEALSISGSREGATP